MGYTLLSERMRCAPRAQKATAMPIFIVRAQEGAGFVEQPCKGRTRREAMIKFWRFCYDYNIHIDVASTTIVE